MSQDKTLNELTELSTVASGDLVYVVDVSDTSDSSAGSSRKVQVGNLRMWEQTAAETSAGVTPTNLQYEPGNVLRYGTNTTPGTTDMSTAIRDAIDVVDAAGGGVVFIPTGTYLVSQDSTNAWCINLGGKDEITFCQAVNLVRTHGNTDFSPRQKNIRMMSLLFSNLSHFVYKGKRLYEVGKLVCPGNMMFFNHIPSIYLFFKSF